MVLLEALSRLRPVIIFKDIDHVVGNKKGIFIADRNSISFFEKINYIKKNYLNIQQEMKMNSLGMVALGNTILKFLTSSFYQAVQWIIAL